MVGRWSLVAGLARSLLAPLRPVQNGLTNNQSPTTDYTIPFRNSSSGYLVPRQTTPSCHSVTAIERTRM